MMNGRFSPPHLLAFIFMLALLLTIVQLGLVSWAFEKLGLSPTQGMLLLFASLFSSVFNLPLTSIKAERPEIEVEIRTHHGLLRVPLMPFTGRTLIAVNVGGCLVPLTFTMSLIHRFPLSAGEIVLAVGISTLVCYITSRPIQGIGIGIAPLVAPLTAAIVALLIDRELAAPLAYISGTLGVLIGADLLRMKDVAKLGAPIASIGGAGTFDGIFLTGMVAVLLT